MKHLGLVGMLLSIIMALGTVIVLTPIKSSAQQQQQQQQEAQNSTIGTYAQGYEKGKLNAQNTFNSGGNYNGTCVPHAYSTTYCVGYSTGYNLEWAKLKVSNWWMKSK
jgi:type II secretory pathway pseudopilin PulG